VDTPGLVLVTGAALGLVWGLVRGNTAGWASVEVLTMLIGGAVLAVAFVAWEVRARQPMLPMRLFRSRAFASGNAVGFLMFASLFSAVFFMAQFLQTSLGESPFHAGLQLIPWTGTVMVVSPIAGALVDRIGERPLLVGGLLLQAAGFAWVALEARAGLPYSTMIAPLIIAGVGISSALPAAQNSVMSSVATAEIGKASGTFSMMRQLGGAFGLAIAVAVFSGAGSYASPGLFSNGFGPAIAVSAALSLFGALAGAAAPARRIAPSGAALQGAGAS
jgi:MFS family permease